MGVLNAHCTLYQGLAIKKWIIRESHRPRWYSLQKLLSFCPWLLLHLPFLPVPLSFFFCVITLLFIFLPSLYFPHEPLFSASSPVFLTCTPILFDSICFFSLPPLPQTSQNTGTKPVFIFCYIYWVNICFLCLKQIRWNFCTSFSKTEGVHESQWALFCWLMTPDNVNLPHLSQDPWGRKQNFSSVTEMMLIYPHCWLHGKERI